MCHVLVIEDEPIIAEYVSELALDAGASSVAFASTEKGAISAAHDERPAVIFSDVRLSQGTGPRAVCQIINSLGPIPVIFITASPEQCNSNPHVVAVLNKPLDSDVIQRTFRKACQEGISIGA